MTSSLRRRPAASCLTLSPIAIAALLALSAAPLAANAVTYTWTGGVGNDWGNAGSWQGNAAPPLNGLATSDLIFSTSGAVFPSIGDAYVIRSLTFATGASAFTFDSGSLTLGVGGITQYAPTAQGFSTAQVVLGADQTWTLAAGSGSLTFGSGVNTTGGGTGRALTVNALTTTGSGNVINGVISGSGSLTKTGAGILTLTGASTYTGTTTVSAGTLAIASGASITGGNVRVNAGATMAISGNVSASSFTVDGSTASTASVNLGGSAGNLTTGSAYVGEAGSGTFNQTGGSFTSSSLMLGRSAGSSGTFNQSGGSVTIDVYALDIGLSSGSSGSYNLSGSASSLSTVSVYVGRSGSGSFNQSGGSFTTNGHVLYLGFFDSGSGTYNLSGNTSSLASGMAYVGFFGSGSFNQSGGSFTTTGNALVLGYSPRGSGIYNLSGGSLTTSRTQVSDEANTSVFIQTGGTHTTTTLSLTGFSPSSQGTYNLNGGTLAAGTVTSGDYNVSGTSTFNFNGGTLQARAATTTLLQGLTTANVQAGGAGIDTAGFDITIAQALVHDTTTGAPTIDGGLTKLGAGTLTLTGANTFTGGLNLAAGTLAVAAESNLGGSRAVTVDGGGALLFTGSATLSRTYNLGVATLVIGSGNTLTFGSGAVINGGFLKGPGTDVLANGATLNAVTSLVNSTLTQSNGAATLRNSTVRGTLAQTGGTLAFDSGFVSGSGRLNVAGTVNTTGTEIQGVTTITSGGMLANSGGSLYLTGGSRTTINSGGTLSTASGSTIELNGSQLVNNGRQSGVLNINFGSLAKGSGSFGTINVADGGKFSPGNSPGTATAENFTFGAGGRYDFELNTANPRFGIDSDLLIVTDTLFVTAGTTTNSVFTLAIDSLNQANQPAALSDFDSSRAYHFLVVDANNVSGYASAKFNVDTSGFLNNLNGGRFSVSLSGNDLYLDFNPMPVPEPATWAMWLAAVAVGAGLQARRRHLSQR